MPRGSRGRASADPVAPAEPEGDGADAVEVDTILANRSGVIATGSTSIPNGTSDAPASDAASTNGAAVTVDPTVTETSDGVAVDADAAVPEPVAADTAEGATSVADPVDGATPVWSADVATGEETTETGTDALEAVDSDPATDDTADAGEVVADDADAPTADASDGGGPDDPDAPPAEGLAPQPKKKGSWLSGRNGAIVAGVAAAAVILVGAIVIGSGDGKSSSSSGVPAAASAAAGGKCAQYDVLSAMHAFNRPDNPTSIGTTDNLQSWTTENATFGLTGKQAFVAKRTSGEAAQAVVKMDAGDGTVCADIAGVSPDTGVIFRWQDPSNYWRVTAVPKVATWNITKVENGVATIVANTGVARVSDGTVISVRLLGPQIRVYVDAKLAKTIQSPFLASARYAGIVAAGPGSAAKSRWAGFIADSYTAADAKRTQAGAGKTLDGGTAAPTTTAGKK
jgi:hypothetical protein